MESIEQMRERLAEYDRQAAAAATNAELDKAIQASGVTLRPGTTEQVRTLLGPDVRRYQSGSEVIVAGPGGKPLADHIRERFAGDLSHFAAPTEPAQPQFSRPTAPQTVGGVNAIAAELRAMGAIPTQGAASFAGQPAPSGNPQTDMSKPFGLRGR